MAWIYKDDDEGKIFGELNTLTDQFVGLLAATILEERLESAIKANLHDTANKTLFRTLFNYTGVVGSFGNKINIGFAIGLYREDTMHDMHNIRRIIDEVSHKNSPKDFNAANIKSLSSKLKIAEKYIVSDKESELEVSPESLALANAMIRNSSVADIKSPRNRFIRSVELISAFLFFEDHLSNSVRRNPKF
jgi:hypothetical protein